MLAVFKNNKFASNIILTCLCLLPLSLVFSIFISELILFIIIINFIILNFVHVESRKYYKTFLFKLFITFWLLLIVSSFLSENIFNSTRTSLFYFRFGFLVLSIIYLLEYEKKFLRYFFFSVVITLLLLLTYSILQKFILHNAVDPNRISGFFGSELIQGSYFLRMMPIFFGLLFLVNFKIKKNLIFILSYCLAMFIILISGERSAIILFILFSFLIFLYFPIKFSIKFLVASLISIIFISSFFFQTV